ncbi:hypothetical protein SLS62_004403 [Diatrype stigma]|uniref:Uncharacterized protein n=1 Tax=Diatrype stigma TaxID=117547 RepID=A0AAN9YTM4_9PEZI
MGRPRLIILIRHAQSEGNKNREIHQTIPDHRVKLTQDGWAQARDAGRRLRALLKPEDTIQFFTSPYRRTRETTEGILETLTSEDPEPTPFKRDGIKVYEEPRLREQDFGNFQPCSAEMERMWQERADYGHFFYRIPDGESAADAYDRVSGFNESLWRQFGEDDFPSVCVLVTHGLMSRVFLMKWYHFTVEYFEDLRNVNHCEFLIMRQQFETGKYILENKLRTWSELRRERAALMAKEEKENGGGKANSSKDSTKMEKHVHTPRKWGGCPQGCNHGQNFKIRRDLAELRQDDEFHAKHNFSHGSGGVGGGGTNGNAGAAAAATIASRRAIGKQLGPNNSDDDSDDPRGRVTPPETRLPDIDVTRAREEVVSSPDGTPSFINIGDRLRGHPPLTKAALLNRPAYLHVGRDGGGTYSGHASEEETSEISEDDARRRLASRAERVKMGAGGDRNGANNNNNTNGKDAALAAAGAKYLSSHHAHTHAHANRLGDAPQHSDQGSSDGGDEAEADADGDGDEDLDKAEAQDRSIKGSVY